MKKIALAALFVLCAGGAGFLTVRSIYLGLQAGFHERALLVWAASWLLGLAVLLVINRKASFRTAFSESFNWFELAIVLAVLVVGLKLRLGGLADFPAQLHNDEMSCGLAARLLDTQTPPALFGTGWLGFSNFGFYLTKLFLDLFGDNLFGLRMSSVVFGVVSLLASYLLVRLHWSIGIGQLVHGNN